ncbi:MAG: hypothetical protein ABR548_12345 [Actinomycetota bacterium]|nr:hypothetical protein [Actinomycetota bacterium]
MKRIGVLAAVMFVVLLAFGTTAFAASHRSTGRNVVLAQESPADCGGGVCTVDQPTGFGGDVTNTGPVHDPPGHTIRSLLSMAVIGALLVAYLRWALQRGKTPA